MMILNKIIILVAALLMITGINVFAQVQDSSEPIGTDAKTSIKKKDDGKVLKDLTLGTIQIKYKIQTPRIKFAMERIPIDLTVDTEKLENLNGLIRKQPKRLIFMNKRLERPNDIEASRLIRHTTQGQ